MGVRLAGGKLSMLSCGVVLAGGVYSVALSCAVTLAVEDSGEYSLLLLVKVCLALLRSQSVKR